MRLGFVETKLWIVDPVGFLWVVPSHPCIVAYIICALYYFITCMSSDAASSCLNLELDPSACVRAMNYGYKYNFDEGTNRIDGLTPHACTDFILKRILRKMCGGITTRLKGRLIFAFAIRAGRTCGMAQSSRSHAGHSTVYPS